MVDPVRQAEALLAEARASTDERLERLALALERQLPGTLGAALAYALRTSGKRVRPALVLASYRAGGGRAPGIAGLAAAIEIVHTYSLVHDDLPCMDDDDQRRGRPTTHVAFDVPTATRVGLLLVPVAVEMLCQAAREIGLDTEAVGRLGAELLRASGIRGMVGGQWLDLAAEGERLDLARLQEVHCRKTGALIEAGCRIGALAAMAPAGVVAAVSAFGQDIGLAFQIADDLLDATGTTAQLGKTAGRDATLAKSTYVGVLGIELARAEAERLATRAVQRLRAGGVDSPALESLAGYIVQRQS